MAVTWKKLAYDADIVTTFVGLTDTPANYTGQAGKYLKANAGEDALEFGTPAGTAAPSALIYLGL